MALIDKSSIVLPKGFYGKANVLQGFNPQTENLVDLDVVRNTTATRINEQGLIESVAANVPRRDFLNGGCGDLLVEPQRTNLLTYSEDFSNAAWIKVNSTISANAEVAPDGTTTADNFIPDATNTEHIVEYFSTGIAAGRGVNSFFVKPNGYSVVQITTLSSPYVNYDLGTLNVFESSVNVEGSIIPYPNGWFRVSFVGDYTGVNDRVRIAIVPDISSTRFENFTGDGTSGVLIWGAQLEEGSYPTSYMPTTTAAVTRNQDVISLSNAESLLGDSEGGIFFNASFFNTSSNRITLSDNTNNNRLLFFNLNNRLGLNIIANGNQTVNKTTQPINKNTLYKAGFRYASNDVSFFLDGAEEFTDSGVITYGSNVLNLFKLEDVNSAAPFFGRIRELIVFNNAPTDTELETLTTP